MIELSFTLNPHSNELLLAVPSFGSAEFRMLHRTLFVAMARSCNYLYFVVCKMSLDDSVSDTTTIWFLSISSWMEKRRYAIRSEA